jgi:hypothetical protein
MHAVIQQQVQKYPDLAIPIFARKCLDYIRKIAQDEEGIFRKNGSVEQINWAIENLDKGMPLKLFSTSPLVLTYDLCFPNLAGRACVPWSSSLLNSLTVLTLLEQTSTSTSWRAPRTLTPLPTF